MVKNFQKTWQLHWAVPVEQVDIEATPVVSVPKPVSIGGEGLVPDLVSIPGTAMLGDPPMLSDLLRCSRSRTC